MQVFLQICFAIVLLLAIPSAVYLVRPGVLPDSLRTKYTGSAARNHVLVTFELLLMMLPRLAHWNSVVGLVCVVVALAMMLGQSVRRGRRRRSSC